MEYDAFISYRRENGFYIAHTIQSMLAEKGVDCFLDLKGLSPSGRFDTELRSAIQSAPNFILILSKDSLNRCKNKADWLRDEICEATAAGKNIVTFRCTGFEWPYDKENEFPEEIRLIDSYQGVTDSPEYFSHMIDDLIGKLVNLKRKSNGIFKVATSDLTVIDSVMQGCDFESLFKFYGFEVEERKYAWSDKILDDLCNGKIDIAIYNKESCLDYNARNGNKLKIVRDVCSSMGGRNFYILASKKGRWCDMTLEQFKQSLDSETVFCVKKSSDMYKNLLYILDMTEAELEEKGIEVFDYDSNLGLNMFKFNPNLLLIGGQDIRFLAEQSDEYFEIISYDDFPQEKKQFFYKNSINSLIVGPGGLEKLKKFDLEKIGNDLMINFYKNAMDKDSLSKSKHKLSNKLIYNFDSEEKVEYIIDKILFETYRLL